MKRDRHVGRKPGVRWSELSEGKTSAPGSSAVPREALLLHTADEEAEPLHTDKQGDTVSGIQLEQGEGLTNLSRSSLCRGTIFRM